MCPSAESGTIRKCSHPTASAPRKPFPGDPPPQPTCYCRPPQAASSMTQISSPPFGRTSCTGKEAGASRSSALPSGGRFPAPVTKYRQQRDALIISSVNVMRRLSGLGARCSATAAPVRRPERSASGASSGLPGNSEAVCPSSPMPSRAQSRRGLPPSAGTCRRKISS